MMVYLAISIFETQVQKTLNSIWIKLCNVGHFVGQLLEQSLINTHFMSVNAAKTTIKYILLVLCIYLWWLDKSVVRSFSPQHFEFRSKSRSPENDALFCQEALHDCDHAKVFSTELGYLAVLRSTQWRLSE